MDSTVIYQPFATPYPCFSHGRGFSIPGPAPIFMGVSIPICARGYPVWWVRSNCSAPLQLWHFGTGVRNFVRWERIELLLDLLANPSKLKLDQAWSLNHGDLMKNPWKRKRTWKKPESSMVQNWRFQEKSMIEVMEFTWNFYGFYSEGHGFYILFHGIFMQFSWVFMKVSWYFTAFFMLSPCLVQFQFSLEFHAKFASAGFVTLCGNHFITPAESTIKKDQIYFNTAPRQMLHYMVLH